MENNQIVKVNFKIYEKGLNGVLIFVKEADFNDEVVKIGKGTAATLRLDDENMGLMHTYIRCDAGQVILSDVVSKTGTFVNGQKVSKTTLNPGDEVTIGKYLLVMNFQTPGKNPITNSSPTFKVNSDTVTSELIDSTSNSDKKVVLVKSYENGEVTGAHVVHEVQSQMRKKIIPAVFYILGAIFLLTGLFMGYKSVSFIYEKQNVNTIVKEIAKEKGLSDKYVPKITGSRELGYGFFLFSIAGGLFISIGMALSFRNKKIKTSFTVGEDPSASMSINSKLLPSHKFPIITGDEDNQFHVLVPKGMKGSIKESSGKIFMADELISLNRASKSELYPGVVDIPLPIDATAQLEMDTFKWVFMPGLEPKRENPIMFKREFLYFQIAAWLFVAGSLASYFNYIKSDEMFSDDPDLGEMTIRKIYKSPVLTAQNKKTHPHKLKNPKEIKDIYRKNNKKNSKNPSSAPRDPRFVAIAGSKGNGSDGISRMSGPQGMGVANVLASQINAMTASLTASNTVFGQETEDFDDLLGDDVDGEPMGDSFGPRGTPGAGPGGGLGIFGNNPNGFGSINLDGGPLGPGVFNTPPGIHRRKITTRGGTPQVYGKLDPNEVRNAIRSHRREVRHCYQKGLMVNEKVAGSVRVVFFISMTGYASRCTVSENLSISSVGQCICNRVKSWRFPSPQGGLAKISYSWTLQPGN